MRIHASHLRWLEAVVIPASALFVSGMLSPRDPLLLGAPFPWLVLPLILVALRYGKGAGAVSLGVLLSSLAWAPQPAFLWVPAATGLILVTMLCGEYADSWVMRSARTRARCDVMEERMRRLTEDLHVIRISHERLEQNLIYKPMSLRGALEALNGRLARSRGALTAEVADQVLYLLSQMSGVQTAGLYRIVAGRTPVMLAVLGAQEPLRMDDPVCRSALTHGQSRSLADVSHADGRHYLAIHVFADPRGGVIVLAVSDMAFLSLHKDNLLVIEAIFQYVCQQQVAIERGLAVLAEWPDCPVEFAAGYMRLSALEGRLGVGSRLLSYRVRARQDAEGVVRRLAGLCRGMDMVWVHRAGTLSCVLFLLPFAGPAMIDGHIERAHRSLAAHFGDERYRDFLSVADHDLTGVDPVARLRRIVGAQEAA